MDYLSIQVHKKVTFSRRDNWSLAVKGLRAESIINIISIYITANISSINKRVLVVNWFLSAKLNNNFREKGAFRKRPILL